MKKILLFALLLGFLSRVELSAQQDPIWDKEWILTEYVSAKGKKFSYEHPDASPTRLAGGSVRFKSDCNHCHISLKIDQRNQTIRAEDNSVPCTDLYCDSEREQAKRWRDQHPLLNPDKSAQAPEPVQEYAPSFHPRKEDKFGYKLGKDGRLEVRAKDGTFYFRVAPAAAE